MANFTFVSDNSEFEEIVKKHFYLHEVASKVFLFCFAKNKIEKRENKMSKIMKTMRTTRIMTSKRQRKMFKLLRCTKDIFDKIERFR